MSKEVAKQVETRWKGSKASRTRDMLLTLEGRVVNLKESMRDTKETFKMMGGHIEELILEKEQLKEHVAETLSSNEDNEATVAKLHKKIEELEGELAFCHVTVGKRVFGRTPSHKVDASKLKKFKGASSIREVDNLWEIEQYFCTIGIKEDDAKVNTASLYLTNVALLWCIVGSQM
ncbi:hypothetical protein Golob_015091 [Gossypium lobatum]|uniref:Uncharacterized protein n=1 Tax=Gossypium lobatum TaxID=34289 RepID=A0A7J8M023_9ROSI|nr:hypothetical protein [Gossypium lobatum]